MTTCLVFGAYGLLGHSLCSRLVERGYAVLRQGRSPSAQVSIDPLDVDSLSAVLGYRKIDAVVNLIAATNVDECEADTQSAYRGNVQVVESLVRALEIGPANSTPHLVQLSTDQVYDGPGPHEERTVAPANVYGLSKLAGEFVAARVGATIVRTNFFGRSRCANRMSLTDWIVSSLRAGQHITVFEDVLFSALHIDTLCVAIDLAINQRYAGTSNVGCRDGGSKADLALGLADLLGLDRH